MPSTGCCASPASAATGSSRPRSSPSGPAQDFSWTDHDRRRAQRRHRERHDRHQRPGPRRPGAQDDRQHVHRGPASSTPSSAVGGRVAGDRGDRHRVRHRPAGLAGVPAARPDGRPARRRRPRDVRVQGRAALRARDCRSARWSRSAAHPASSPGSRPSGRTSTSRTLSVVGVVTRPPRDDPRDSVLPDQSQLDSTPRPGAARRRSTPTPTPSGRRAETAPRPPRRNRPPRSARRPRRRRPARLGPGVAP